MGQFEVKNNSSSTNNYNDDNGLHHTSKYNICDFIQICLFILNRIFYRTGSFILLYLFLYFVCGLFFKLKWYPHNLIMMKYAVQWHSIHAKLAHPSSLSSVQSLSRVRLFATPWIAAHQASLSTTISQSSLKLTSIESVMPSSHLILCHPLLFLPPVPPSIRVLC